MILAAPPPLIDLPPAAPAVEVRDVARTDRTGATALRHRVFYGPLRIGKHVYPLRKAIRGELLPAPAMPAYSLRPDRTEVRVPDLPGDDFLGRGATAAEAWDDWFDRFHTQFQQLYRTPGFERTADQEVVWRRLCRIVDVTAYQQSQPLEAREVGLLTSNEPGRRRVEWVGRGVPEQISSRVSVALPEEFAALRSGQWFEMTTVRHPADGRLLGGSGVTPLRRSPLKANAEELAEFEAAWEPTSALPATTWD
ncbi:hypothetical protein [Alienimonas sp. DA493]|uniref:hypothetical protein n=1 Tax=Alienimonas sp. DA493 TaxID=3373605 RepID=UPI0037541861